MRGKGREGGAAETKRTDRVDSSNLLRQHRESLAPPERLLGGKFKAVGLRESIGKGIEGDHAESGRGVAIRRRDPISLWQGLPSPGQQLACCHRSGRGCNANEDGSAAALGEVAPPGSRPHTRRSRWTPRVCNRETSGTVPTVNASLPVASRSGHRSGHNWRSTTDKRMRTNPGTTSSLQAPDNRVTRREQ